MAVEQNSGVRTLPVIMIHDTEFLVDIKNLEFIQFDDNANRIHFRDVRDLGSHTEVTYDPTTKNVFRGSLEDRLSRKDVVDVRLPSAIDLDTQGLADEIVINIRKQRDLKGNDNESKTEELRKPAGKKRGHRR